MDDNEQEEWLLAATAAWQKPAQKHNHWCSLSMYLAQPQSTLTIEMGKNGKSNGWIEVFPLLTIAMPYCIIA